MRIINISESPTPLLSLSILVDKSEHDKFPLHFTDHKVEDLNDIKEEEQWEYNLSFLSPSDLLLLKACIDIAIEADFDNKKMAEAFNKKQKIK